MKFWSNFCGNEARLQCNGCRADSLTQFSRNHHRHHHRHDHHRPSGACRQFDPILSQSRRQPVIFHPDCSFSTLGWISALPCNRTDPAGFLDFCLLATEQMPLKRRLRDKRQRRQLTQSLSFFPIGTTRWWWHGAPMFNLQLLLSFSVTGTMISGNTTNNRSGNKEARTEEKL